MFVIYTPELGSFLKSIIPIEPIPWLEWDHKIHDTGNIPSKDDAILMAKEVQRIRVAQEIFHFGVQVLELGSNNLPNFKKPVYELSKPTQISIH
jgi:hypothetical protein